MRQAPVVSAGINTDGMFDGGSLGFCEDTYERLQDAVLRLIRDSELRDKMGEKAQAYAFSHYSVSNIEKLISVM